MNSEIAHAVDCVACPYWCHGVLPYSTWHGYVAWQKLDTNTPSVDFLTHSPALSALRVFKHHLSSVPSPPCSAPLDVPTQEIHFIDFKHPPDFLTPFLPAHLFWQTIQSSWYPPHLIEATTNRFLRPSVNVKPSTWLLLSHHRLPAPSHLCPTTLLPFTHSL